MFQGGLPNPIQFSLGNLFLSRYDGISITHESSPIDWKLKRGLELNVIVVNFEDRISLDVHLIFGTFSS